jgi:mRNA deadenylase 3'-5' endonuclease subunit Ccr4
MEAMPRISSFYGILIYMYYMDHNPAHFHAIYGDYEAIFDINTLGLIKGNLPPKAIVLVEEWASLHQSELLENWSRVKNNEALKTIEPLR